MKDPSIEKFYSLLGYKKDSIEIQDFINELGEQPESSVLKGHGLDNQYLDFVSHSFIFVFEGRKGLTCVQLYNEPLKPNSDVSFYPGDLPLGLRFDMSRSIVRELLGPPTRSNETTFLPCQPFDYYYDSVHWFSIQYSNEEDYIRMIQFGPPQLVKNAEPDIYVRQNPEMTYAVFVTDNSHEMMEDSFTYKLGEYGKWEKALEAAKAIVDGYLKRQYPKAKNMGDLLLSWKTYGETPKILGIKNSTRKFSARDYAEKKCRELFNPQKRHRP
jgi:hypothetical protein